MSLKEVIESDNKDINTTLRKDPSYFIKDSIGDNVIEVFLRKKVNVTDRKLSSYKLLEEVFIKECSKEYKDKMIQILGLRRSGKTIAMFQLYNTVYEEALFINVLKRSNEFILLDIIQEILFKHDEVKYVFIDEITLARINEIDWLIRGVYSSLVLNYQIQVVITGTESISIAESNVDAMFGRAVLVHFSPVYWKDYDIFSETDFSEYFEDTKGLLNDEENIGLLDSLSVSLSGELNNGFFKDSYSISDFEISVNRLYVIFMLLFSAIRLNNDKKHRKERELFSKIDSYEEKNFDYKNWTKGLISRVKAFNSLLARIKCIQPLKVWEKDSVYSQSCIVDTRLFNIMLLFLDEIDQKFMDYKTLKGYQFEQVLYGQLMLLINRVSVSKTSIIHVGKISSDTSEVDLVVQDLLNKKLYLLELKYGNLRKNQGLHIHIPEILDF